MSSSKKIRDPVHGYISLPKQYCDLFVDTVIFQRLRHIAQTGMGVLYPSAHHDRFSHSLGVYHLGSIAFHCLKRNTKERFDNITWNRFKTSFELACLLHDCAHSPFSHTFEEYYDFPVEKQKDCQLDPILLQEVSDTGFSKDWKGADEPAAHEKASAIVVLKKFRNHIESLGGDPILVVRMILGCLFRSAQDKIIENSLIKLLNGSAIDVDKLDYILRDTWASGVNNVSIDIDRLLSSCTIGKAEKDTEFNKLAFKKSALSVLQTVVDGRNFFHQWIHSHHKVVYVQDLLQKAVENLSKIITPQDPNIFLRKFFSIEAILEGVKINHADLSFYLPTDGDIYSLLKKYLKEIPEAQELFSRKHRKALWKTFAEFDILFNDISSKNRNLIRKNAEKELNKFCKSKGGKDCEIVVLETEPKMVSIKKGELFIEIEGECHSYTKIFNEKPSPDTDKSFFYVYVTEECLRYKEEIVKILLALPGT